MLPSLVPISSIATTDNQKDHDFVNDHVLKTPKWAETSVETLALYLTEPFPNDEQKARSIYCWVTANVEYDLDNFSTHPQDVLQKRVATCDGYSRLFESLCIETGLEAKIIVGHARGRGGQEISSHAWNAVMIDKRWQLVDSTWGAGTLNREKFFERKFDDYYFMTTPEELIYSHFPEDPKWQLLEKEISIEEFEELILVKPAFFKNEIKAISHTRGIINTEEPLKICLSAPDDVLIVAELMDEKENVLPDRFTFIQWCEDQYDIDVAFPDPGNHTLKIYSKRKYDSGAYIESMNYEIQVESVLEGQVGFPVVTDAFREYGLQIRSHWQGIIKTNEQLNVTISAPYNVSILAKLLDENGEMLPDRFTFVKRFEDQCLVKVAFPVPGNYTLQIYAKNTKNDHDSKLYKEALNYIIEAGPGVQGQTGFPVITDAFREYGLQIESPKQGLIKTDGDFKISIFVPKEVMIKAELENEDEIKLPDNLVFAQREDENYSIYAAVPRPGNYSIVIFAKGCNQTEELWWRVLNYCIDAGPNSKGQIEYPLPYRNFLEHSARLYSPFQGRLKAGASQRFVLNVPHAEGVAVINEETWTNLKKENDLFQGEALLIEGELRVSAKFPEDKYYYSLLGYQVS